MLWLKCNKNVDDVDEDNDNNNNDDDNNDDHKDNHTDSHKYENKDNYLEFLFSAIICTPWEFE